MLTLLMVLLLAQEDPGPPVIKRGPNAPRKKVEEKPSTPLPLPKGAEPAAEEPPPRKEVKEAKEAKEEIVATPATQLIYPGRPPLLSRAYDVASEYNASLPSFVCDEIVDRFESNSKPAKWKKKDKVEVDVMYVNGKESYVNPRINGKPFKGADLADTGTWSRGDWGTTLVEVLGSRAEFTKRPEGKDKDTIAGVETEIWDLKVKQEDSHWTVNYGTPFKPSYVGSIWVDPKTARVLRIEKLAHRINPKYEIDMVETVVEYGWVTIGGEKYLMPATSSSMSCQRYTNRCMKNDMVFTNYRKFSAESSISTTESEISFGDPAPVKQEPAKPAAKAKKKN
jgi:hypothetical protein